MPLASQQFRRVAASRGIAVMELSTQADRSYLSLRHELALPDCGSGTCGKCWLNANGHVNAFPICVCTCVHMYKQTYISINMYVYEHFDNIYTYTFVCIWGSNALLQCCNAKSDVHILKSSKSVCICACPSFSNLFSFTHTPSALVTFFLFACDHFKYWISNRLALHKTHLSWISNGWKEHSCNWNLRRTQRLENDGNLLLLV